MNYPVRHELIVGEVVALYMLFVSSFSVSVNLLETFLKSLILQP